MTEEEAKLRRNAMQNLAYVEMRDSNTFPDDDRNAREQLEAVADMLGRCNETMSYGLRAPEDAVRLWRAWRNDPLDIYPDEWTPAKRKRVLGYDPMEGKLPSHYRNKEEK